MFKNIINKIKGRLGLAKPIEFYKDGILQYVTILDINGNDLKLRNCSLHEFENKLEQYDDVNYLINVVQNGKSGFAVLPSYEKFSEHYLPSFFKEHPELDLAKDDKKIINELFNADRKILIAKIKGEI